MILIDNNCFYILNFFSAINGIMYLSFFYFSVLTKIKLFI